jgi:hypothetical protein
MLRYFNNSEQLHEDLIMFGEFLRNWTRSTHTQVDDGSLNFTPKKPTKFTVEESNLVLP